MSEVHYFRTADASKYGLVESIMMQNFRHWISHNQANKTNQHDGRTWTYNSVNAFCSLFPYLTKSQIRRCIESLIVQGVLVRGNYNQSAYEKTSWFAFSNESFCHIDVANLTNGSGESATIDVANLTNRSGESATSHTYIKHILKTTDTSSLSASPPDCPHEILIDLFEKQLPNLAQPKKSLWRAGKNAPAMKARWRWVMTATYEKGERKGQRLATTKDEGIAWFERYFAYVAQSVFLTGASSDWACDLGWLINASNFEKVIAGNYQNKFEAVA